MRYLIDNLYIESDNPQTILNFLPSRKFSFYLHVSFNSLYNVLLG